MRATDRFVGLAALLMMAGCAEESFPPPPPPVMTADSKPEIRNVPEQVRLSGERRAFDGLKFSIPATWTEISLSDFQKGIISAKFSMPEAGDDVTLTLSRSGGGLDANLDRWRGQVQSSRPEITDTFSVAGVDASLIDLEGRFSGGFGREPEDGWRMLGVIAPLSDQGYFMKLTGPADQVSVVEEDFLKFAKSAVRE